MSGYTVAARKRRRKRAAPDKQKKKELVPYEVKLAVFERDGWRCYRCQCRVMAGRKRRRKGLPLATIDHYLPRHAGGSNSPDNLRTCCRTCNERKGGRLPKEHKRMTEIRSMGVMLRHALELARTYPGNAGGASVHVGFDDSSDSWEAYARWNDDLLVITCEPNTARGPFSAVKCLVSRLAIPPIDYMREVLHGLLFDRARAIVERHGLRIVADKVDGEPSVTTLDIRNDRVRVEVQGGVIVAVRRYG